MEQEYVVQEGDNLSTILYNLTGDGSYANATRVAEQNGISNPSHIEPGQTIRINVENTSTSSNSGGGTTTASTTPRSANSQSTSSSVPRGGHSSPSGVSQVAFEEASAIDPSSSSSPSNQSSETSIPSPKTNATAGSVAGLNAATGRDQEIRPVQMDPASTTSTSSQTSGDVSSSASSVAPRGTTFSYGIEEDDSIEYNVEEARKILVGAIDPDISKICGIITSICNTLADLQKVAHDKENTNVAQDYKDFETIIGDEAEGLVGFISDAFDVSVSVYETINEWERITQK